MEIVIADHSRTDLSIEVHAAECHHLDRLTSRGFMVGEPMDFDTRAEVFFDYNGDFYEEGGKDACHHLAFKPCVKDLPNGEWPSEFGIVSVKVNRKALIEEGNRVHAEALAAITEPAHELMELVDGEDSARWECKCGEAKTHKTRKLARDGYSAHVRKANKA